MPSDVRIEVEVRDAAGSLLAAGGRSGSLRRADEDDLALTASATAFLGEEPCGVPTSTQYAVPRNRLLLMRRVLPDEDCVFVGDELHLEVAIPTRCESAESRELAISVIHDHMPVTQGWEVVSPPGLIPAGQASGLVRLRFDEGFPPSASYVVVAAQVGNWTQTARTIRIARGLDLKVGRLENRRGRPRDEVPIVHRQLAATATLSCMHAQSAATHWRLVKLGAGGGAVLPLVAVPTDQVVLRHGPAHVGLPYLGEMTMRRQHYEIRLAAAHLPAFLPPLGDEEDADGIVELTYRAEPNRG